MRDNTKKFSRFTRRHGDMYLAAMYNTGVTSFINHGNSTPDIRGDIIDQLGRLEDLFEALSKRLNDPSLTIEKITQMIKEKQPL